MSGIRLVEELREAHYAAEYYVYPDWAHMLKAAANRVEHLESQLADKDAEIAWLRAEVERLTPKPMTLAEAAKTLERLGYKGVEWNANKVCVFSYGGDGITLGEKEARYIAQGLLRDAGAGDAKEAARGEGEGC